MKIWIFLLILFSFNNSITSTTKCSPSYFDVLGLPEKPQRLEKYPITIVIEQFEKLRECANESNLFLSWSLLQSTLPENTAKPWLSATVNITGHKIHFLTVYGGEIPLNLIFNSGWALEVTLPQTDSTKRVKFAWWPGEINLFYGFSDLNLLLEASLEKDFALRLERKDLTARYFWRAEPNIYHLKDQTLFLIIPISMLQPFQIFSVNVTWFFKGELVVTLFKQQIVSFDKRAFQRSVIKRLKRDSGDFNRSVNWNVERQDAIETDTWREFKLPKISISESPVYRDAESIHTFTCSDPGTDPTGCENLTWGHLDAWGKKPRWYEGAKVNAEEQRFIFPPNFFNDGESVALTVTKNHIINNDSAFEVKVVPIGKLEDDSAITCTQSPDVCDIIVDTCVLAINLTISDQYIWTIPEKYTILEFKISEDTKTFTIPPDSVSLPSSFEKYDENPIYNVELNINAVSAGIAGSCVAKFLGGRPLITNLLCQPSSVDNAQQNSIEPTDQWLPLVSNGCPFVTTKCHILYKSNANSNKLIQGFEWFPKSSLALWSESTTNIQGDTILIENNAFQPGETSRFAVRFLGRNWPSRVVEINWKIPDSFDIEWTTMVKTANPWKETLLVCSYKEPFACPVEMKISMRNFFAKDKMIIEEDKGGTSKKVTIPAFAFKSGDKVVLVCEAGDKSKQIRVSFTITNTKLEIKCLGVNCADCDPELPLHLTVVCSDTHAKNVIRQRDVHTNKDGGSCVDLQYVWWLEAKDKAHRLDKFVSSVRGDDLIIPGGVLLNQEDSYEPKIRVNLLRDNTISETLENVTCRKRIPELKLTCQPDPCDDLTMNEWIVYVPLILAVTCKKDCDHVRRINYEFSKEPKMALKRMGFDAEIPAYSYDVGDELVITIYNEGKVKRKLRRKFRFKEPTPEFYISCSHNCDKNEKSDPRLTVRLHMVCTKNCFMISNLTWAVREYPTNSARDVPPFIPADPLNRTIIIKEDTFKHRINTDKNYVEVTLSTSGASATRILKFQEPKGKLIIECLENCVKESNPTEEVKLRVLCVKTLACQVERYTWDIKNKPDGFDWSTAITFEDNNRTLVIHPNAFTPSEIPIKFTVRNGKGTPPAQIPLLFKLPSPVLELICLLDTNCGDLADPYRPSQIKVRCTKNCRDQCTYEWKLVAFENQTSTNYTEQNMTETFGEFFDEKAEFVVKGEKIKKWEALTFTVTSCDTSISKIVRFNYTPPQVDIECISNCIFDPIKDTVIKVNCKGQCDPAKYKWSLSPAPKAKDWENKILLEDPIITIPRLFYRVQDSVNVTVKIRNATTSIKILFARPPWGGFCEIYPNKGVAAFTKFVIYCVHFVSTATYYVFQESKNNIAEMGDDETNLGVRQVSNPAQSIHVENETHLTFLLKKFGVLLKKTRKLPITDLWLASVPDSVIVAVASNWTIHVLIRLDVDVEPAYSRESAMGIPMLVAINQRLFDESISALKQEERYEKILQLANALDTELMTPEITDQLSYKDLSHYRAHFFTIMDIISHQIHPIQLITFYRKLILMKHCQVSDAYTSYLISEHLIRSLQFLQKSATTPVDVRSISLRVIKQFTFEIMSITEFLSNCSFNKWKNMTSRTALSLDYPLFTDLIADEEIEFYYVSHFSKSIPIIIEYVIHIWRSTRKPTESPILENYMFKAVAPSYAWNNRTIRMHGKNVFVKLHPFLEDELLAYGQQITYIMAVFEKNIWDWDKATQYLQIPLIMFDIYSGSNPIREISSPILIHFPVSQNKTRRAPMPNYSNQNTKSAIAYRLPVVPGSLVRVRVKNPFNQTILAVLTTEFPSQAYFEKHRVIVRPQRTKYMNYVAQTKRVFVTFRKKIPLDLEVKMHICFSYGSHSWRWSTNDCVPHYLNRTVICSCKHLSMFAAATVDVEHERIQFGDIYVDYRQNIFDYTVILLTFMILMGAVALLALAFFIDKNLHKIDIPIFLADNLPGDKILYVVTVTTGTHWNAGTTSVVGIQLQGDVNSSRRHLLNPPGICREVLQRNSMDCFLLFTRQFLGNIYRVRLWHNSSGPKPHWFCERIVVQHYESKQIFVFEVNSWISIIHGPRGKCHLSVPLSTKRCRSVIKMNFVGRARQAFLDTTLELSFFFHRLGTNFDCRERMMVLLVSTFVVMLVAFFLVQNNLEVTFSQVIISAIIFTVVQLIFTALFLKSSNCRITDYEE